MAGPRNLPQGILWVVHFYAKEDISLASWAKNLRCGLVQDLIPRGVWVGGHLK
jgi:hypothetical protein